MHVICTLPFCGERGLGNELSLLPLNLPRENAELKEKVSRLSSYYD